MVVVNYNDESSIIAALKGQQFLIITLAATAPPDLHSTIVKAAVKAGVKYIMPNCYGIDIEDRTLGEESSVVKAAVAHCREIESLGAIYVAAVCGFWYHWSLALGESFFGFDIKNRKVTLFDDGNTKINTSTWEQCGRALAALLSLPESGASPSLSDWKNKPLYFSSFLISQRDMFDSLNRVLGTTDDDWEISHEPTPQRYKDGLAQFEKGDRLGFAKAMYSRVFFPNGGGDYQSSKGLANEVLGLPEESLDQATKETVEMVESGWRPW